MANRFSKNDLKCVVISPSSTVRGLISSILKELSFTNITTVPDIKTCIEIIEAEPVSWVISPTKDSNEGNVLHLLNILDKTPALRALKISILRDDDDSVIPQAFELGALSAHKFETSKEACLQEFHTLLQRIDRHDGDCTRVAADYLADYLTDKQEFQELKRFYVSLQQIYPGNSDILLGLARTLCRAQEPIDAKILLRQLMLTAPEKKIQIDELRREYFSGETLEAGPSEVLAAHFGFQTCLILDSDSASLAKLSSMMTQVGFQKVVPFQDPIQLMKWVRQNPAPDLVISEWQLPLVPGPIFLYKLRNRLELDVPIIVMNQKIADRDIMWLKELGVSCLMPKPIVEKNAFKAIVWTMQQSKGPSDLQSLKNKLKVLSKKQDAELPKFRQLFMKHPMLIESERLLMEAQLSYDAGCFLHAKKYALDAVRETGDPREALEILSKSLMKLREFDAALRCLDNVSNLSPYNVTYLCEIAECHLENGDDTKYETFLDQAKDLDPDAQIVLETEAKGAMKRGHTETAKKLLQSLKSFKEVLAFMNNRAVSLILVGNHNEGLDLYQKALASVPDGQQEVRALLSYNLGLGLARSQRLREAIETLATAAQTRNPNRLKKVNSLRARIKKALETGEALVFPSEKPPTLEEEESKLKMLREIEMSTRDLDKVSRSDYCVHKIYRTLLDDSKAKEILANAPTFTPRGKLVKDYIRGMILVP